VTTPEHHHRVFLKDADQLSVGADFSKLEIYRRCPDRNPKAAHWTQRVRRTPQAGSARFAPGTDQSAFAFSIIAACSFLMSSGDNCGRSTLMVSLLSLAVSGNGGL
jgi:hypothetical protein